METPSTTPAAERPAPHPKMAPGGQKRLLALDGGGIRGMITVEILGRIEALLRERTGGGADFRLADYFDYVAGTSTGAIIATCVSLGMSVDEIRGFYEANGKAMFDKAGILARLHNKYDDDRLADKLREVFDGYLPKAEGARGRDHVTLGSAALRTLLLVVMRNATTDSPWPLSSNPWAKYNDPKRADCNARLPLWRLVRASTAAPTYFPPEEIVLGQQRFLFVDGGVTTYNNPAFLLFLMATARPYRLEWPTGADRMLLVSIGTGAAAKADTALTAGNMHLLYNAGTIPGALMAAALHEQDLLCRIFGRCRSGDMLDRELGTLCGPEGESDVLPKLFTYMRYNADLSREGLDRLGLRHLAPDQVQRLDSIDFMPQLQEVGRAVGARVSAEHFDGFVGGVA